MRKHKSLDIFQTVYEASTEEVNEMELKEGQVLGEKERYEVVKMLGVGGMGVVYLVKDKMLENDLMALKIILGKLLKEEKAKQRFRNEIRISRKLKHKNILSVYDYGEYRNLMYYTMEYVDGKNMREWMEEKKSLVLWEELWEIARQILEGLEVAHEETVHRDIKPENVLLEQKGPILRAKICDFGLAQLRSPGLLLSSMAAMGTYNYMAPEQMEDASKVDKRSDLYSVGVLMYECLTQKFPMGKFKAISRVRKDLAEELGEAIEKALESEKQDRYNSAKEMIQALDRFSEKAREKKERQATQAKAEQERKIALIQEEHREKQRQLAQAKIEQERKKRERQAEEDQKAALFLQNQEEEASRIVKREEVFSLTSDVNKEDKKGKKSYAASWILVLLSLCGYWFYQTGETREQEQQAALARKQEQERLERERQAVQPKPVPNPKSRYGLPEEVWANCQYNHNGVWILDMASSYWGNLGYRKQVEHAKTYQEGYAREKGKKIEESFSGVLMRLIPPGRFWMGSPSEEKN